MRRASFLYRIRNTGRFDHSSSPRSPGNKSARRRYLALSVWQVARSRLINTTITAFLPLDPLPNVLPSQHIEHRKYFNDDISFRNNYSPWSKKGVFLLQPLTLSTCLPRMNIMFSPQFSPLKAFGCDLRSNFKATLFRFPLRTEKQALASRLSKQWHGVDDVRALLHAFAKESAGMLLFLKNVERMSVFEWGPGQSEPQKVCAWQLRRHVPAYILRGATNSHDDLYLCEVVPHYPYATQFQAQL